MFSRFSRASKEKKAAMTPEEAELTGALYVLLPELFNWMIPGGHPNSPTCGHPKIPHPDLT